MGTKRLEGANTLGAICVTALLVVFGFAAGPAMGADGVDPDAVEILRGMSTYLGGLQAFSVASDVDVEVIDLEGQKLQLSSSGTLLLARPGKYHSHRFMPSGAFEVYFDGKTVTLFNKQLLLYFQIAAPGTFDQAIDAVRAETGYEMSGADLLYADPYPGLMTDVTSGSYVGTAWVNGVECHQVAFRAEKVDWQLWVQTGDKPLPMKYIITTKWMTGAPQFSVRFRDWDTQPKISDGQFVFAPPAGAKRLESIQFNEVGELQLEGGQP